MIRRFTPRRANSIKLIVLGVMAIGLALRWSSLHAPMALDDWDHYAMLHGVYPVELHPLDLFNFVPDDAAARDALLETGRLPWFASPNLHLSVLRPLASALVYVDYVWLDGQHHVWRLHVHSYLWWLFLLAGAAAVLFRALPFAAATLALLLYTIDDAHTWPAAWIASRSQFVSVGFVLWALWATMKAQQGSPRMRPVALGFGALGLLAGEHALSPLAYLAAFELLGASGTLGARMRRTLPWVLLGVGFIAAHAWLGYGASGSSVYITPLSDPARFLSWSLLRALKLFAECGFGVPADWWSIWPAWQLVFFIHSRFALLGISPELQQVQWGAGFATLVLAVAGCVWLSSARARQSEDQRGVRWLLIGALLSIAPLTATEAMSRLTVAPGFGFAAAFGWAIWKLSCVVFVSPRLVLRPLAALALIPLLYVHVMFVGMRSYYEGKFFGGGWSPQEASRRHTQFGVPNVAGRNIFLLDSPHMTLQFSLMYMLHYAGQPLPRSIEILTPAISNSHVIERVAPNVIDIHFPDPLVGSPFRRSVYRSEDELFREGDVIRAKRFDVTILAVSAGEPTHLRYVFPAPLDDPRYVFMAPRLDMPALMPLQLPPVGQRVQLPPPPLF